MPTSISDADAAHAAFASVADAGQRLRDVGYLTDQAIATVAFLADRLAKPLLVEGPAGVGKTELAKALTAAKGAELVRLQCYEGLDEAKALYEWNYKKQLLRIQVDAARQAEHGSDEQAWEDLRDDIFSDEYLLARPLLRAIGQDRPTVLLIDEVDKVDFEFEALLLEVLSDFQVSIPELGTVTAVRRPTVVLTSNNTRELSEALKRRCLYLHLDYPDAEREADIVRVRVPEVPEQLADQLVRIVRSLRELDLRKAPSISETLDWARTIVALGYGAGNGESLDEEAVSATLGVLLKHATDLDKARAHLAAGAHAARG